MDNDQPIQKHKNNTTSTIAISIITALIELGLLIWTLPKLHECKIAYGAIDSGRCGDPGVIMFLGGGVVIFMFIIVTFFIVDDISHSKGRARTTAIILGVTDLVLIIVGILLFIITVS